MYEKAACSYTSWWSSADGLNRAADRIDPFGPDQNQTSMVYPVYRYLVAMTIECALKGIYVAEKQVKFKGRSGDLINNIKTHHLRNLAQQISLHFSAEDDQLLDDLESYIVWAGRYPIPLDATEYFLKIYGSPIQQQEQDLLQRLFDRLRELDAQKKKASPKP